MKKDGEEPYPHKFNVTISLEEFIEKFNSLTETQILHDQQFSVAGMFLLTNLNLYTLKCLKKPTHQENMTILYAQLRLKTNYYFIYYP